MAAITSHWLMLLSLIFLLLGVTGEENLGENLLDKEIENIAAVIEEVLQQDVHDDMDTQDKKSAQTIHPEVPTLEHIKLVLPDYDAKEITPTDIQKFLEDEDFSIKLLTHASIPESVKEFFRTQRSPVMEAVIPVKPRAPYIGSSKALTLMDILLGVNPGRMLDVIKCDGDESDDDDLLHDTPRRKIKCTPKNVTQEINGTAIIPQVTILNSTELMDRLGSKNESNNLCAVVLFYAPWCVFSARAAPHFNALARVFPQLDVYAINAAHFSKFGTVAVPNILVFHNAKAVARFNNSERVLTNIASFVSNVTGLQGNLSVEVEEEDFLGPLPSKPTDDPDYLLWLSWAFIICFCCYMFTNSRTGLAIFEYIGHLGNIEHQHVD